MSSLIFNNGVDEWFSINYKNKESGSIRIRTSFTAKEDGGDKYELQQSAFHDQLKDLKQEAAYAESQAQAMKEQQTAISQQMQYAMQQQVLQQQQLQAQIAG